MDTGLVTGLTLILVPVLSLAITYWHWRISRSAMGYFAFSMYVLDARMKYLTRDPAEIALYDLPEIKRARAQWIIGMVAIAAIGVVAKSWPPCRILYNCVVGP